MVGGGGAEAAGVGLRGVGHTAVQWKCEADMSTEYRFGTTTVSCEGYDSPGVWHSPL